MRGGGADAVFTTFGWLAGLSCELACVLFFAVVLRAVQNLHTKVVDAMGGDKEMKATVRKKLPTGAKKSKREQWLEVSRREAAFCAAGRTLGRSLHPASADNRVCVVPFFVFLCRRSFRSRFRTQDAGSQPRTGGETRRSACRQSVLQHCR